MDGKEYQKYKSLFWLLLTCKTEKVNYFVIEPDYVDLHISGEYGSILMEFKKDNNTVPKDLVLKGMVQLFETFKYEGRLYANSIYVLATTWKTEKAVKAALNETDFKTYFKTRNTFSHDSKKGLPGYLDTCWAEFKSFVDIIMLNITDIEKGDDKYFEKICRDINSMFGVTNNQQAVIIDNIMMHKKTCFSVDLIWRFIATSVEVTKYKSLIEKISLEFGIGVSEVATIISDSETVFPKYTGSQNNEAKVLVRFNQLIIEGEKWD